MAKIQLKSDNINPFRGLFSIFKQFDCSGLRQTTGGQRCGVTSFKFDSMLPELNLRLVVQRTPVTDEDPDAEPEGLFGTEYVYRCIVNNDWDKSR